MNLPAALDRRFEAALVFWHAGDSSRPLEERVRRLAELGFEVAVLERSANGDAAGRALADLSRRGVDPTFVAVLDHSEEAILAALDDQITRREHGALPELDANPAWTLRVEGVDPERERAHESLLTIGDGRFATSGSPVVAHPAAAPRVLASGLYDGDGSNSELYRCPVWAQVGGRLGWKTRLRRWLDLRSGLLFQEVLVRRGVLGAVAFTSLARPGTVALRARGPRRFFGSSSPLVVSAESHVRRGGRGRDRWVVAAASGGGVAAAARDARLDGRAPRGVERIGVYRADPERRPDPEEALSALHEAEGAGFDRLLAEHRAAWAARWDQADIRIEGGEEFQLPVRFSLFHLMASVADSGEAAVGARGLTGPAYRGHVFWDTDVFVLPFLAATHPEAARAILEYRIRRLPAARERARELGRQGARFAWESARDGKEVTPAFVRDLTGRVIPIRTGQLEEHIVADVAWAASCYVDWTGDEAFAAGPGSDLLTETARYWVSRIRLDREGRGHIYGVIGPDEYHEPVDDNAFTNVMARWNLRRAAANAVGVGDDERKSWLSLADALVDGYDEETGLYEQFSGFFRLEPLLIADVAPRRPIAADLLLGRERVRGSQVIKQADVLMLHHLVPDETAPGSLEPNVHFYEPRTAHGSSLSPGIHAAVLARAGKRNEAVRALRIAARLDLDDLTGTTGGGLHLATMGSVWQALVFGFAGVRPHKGRLVVDPRLPPRWRALDVRLRFRGSPVRIRIEHDGVDVQAEPSVPVEVVGG
jgi:trehalose/maltose hydrolase-like predicted phosphorylase